MSAKVFIKFYKRDKTAIVAATEAAAALVWESETKADIETRYYKYSADGKNNVYVWKRYCGLKRQGDTLPAIFKVCVQCNKKLQGLEEYENAFYSFYNEQDAVDKYNLMVKDIGKKTIPDDPKDIEPVVEDLG